MTEAKSTSLTKTASISKPKIYGFTYNSNNQLTQITDRAGNVTTIQRDGSGNATAIVGPYGHTTALSINSDGDLQSVVTPVSQYALAYQGSTGLLTSLVDPNGGNHTFSYDQSGHLTSDQDPNGGVTNLSQNAVAGTSYTVTKTTSLGRTSNYIVTNGTQSQISQNTLPDGTSSTQQTGSGITELVSTDGTQTLSNQGPDARFGMEVPINSSRTITGSGGVTLQSSQTSTLITNGSDLIIQYTNTQNGNTSDQVYDSASSTSTFTSAVGRSATTTLNSLAQVAQTSVAGLTPVQFGYDSNGRLQTLAQGARTYTLTYGADGQLSSIMNPMNEVTTFAYDSAARLTQETLSGGRQIVYTYDPSGNVTTLTPPSKPAHDFSYTPLNFLSVYSAPNLGDGLNSTDYSYSLDRELLQIAWPQQRSIAMAYGSSSGQLNTVTTPDGTTTVGYTSGFPYPTSYTTPDGEVLGLAYEGSLLSGETWGGGAIGGSVSFTYNSDFNVASESVDGATTVNFSYDADRLLTQAGSLSLTLDPHDGNLNASSNGAVSEAFGYSTYGELSAHTAAYGGTPLLNISYTRDALGRIQSKSETVAGATHAYAYSYDTSDRLSQVSEDGNVISSYSYDLNGNRTSASVNGTQVSTTYDAQDQLTAYGTISYTYNPQGQLVSETDSSTGNTTTFTYDVLGNLKAVNLPNNTAISYVVDGLNRRIGKKVGGSLSEGFLYSGKLKVVAQLDSNGNVVSRFVYGTRISSPDYMIKGGVTYQIIADHLGSPRLVVSTADGTIAEQLTYDEFGNVLSDSNPGFQPFGFAACLYDQDTKLCRFRARDYDASTGRWLSKDPIGFGGGDSNLYGYALQDPINGIDPSGLSSVVFDRGSGTILIYSGSGQLLAAFPAANNVQSSAPAGAVPNGTFPYVGHVPHSGGSSGPYGSNGNFVFNFPNGSGIGIHSGRVGVPDGLGRTGYQHATNGCIRTTDAATSFLGNLNSTDPLTSITVQ
jgi:RHS repeat-associated protein